MIEVNKEYCKGCGLCIRFCPVDALERAEELNERGIYEPIEIEDKCTGCRLCEMICPDFAIIVEEEEEKKSSKKEKVLLCCGVDRKKKAGGRS